MRHLVPRLQAIPERKPHAGPRRAPLLADPERLESHDRPRRDGPALHASSRGHRQGRPVRPGVPQALPQQPHAGNDRPGRTGRPPGLDLRIRRHPAISRPQDRTVLRLVGPRPDRHRPVADVADGRCRPDGGPGAPFPQVRAAALASPGPSLRAGALPGTRSRGSTACSTPGSGKAGSSPATTRSPTWPSGHGRRTGKGRSRTSRTSPTLRAGWTRSDAARRSSGARRWRRRCATVSSPPDEKKASDKVLFGQKG